MQRGASRLWSTLALLAVSALTFGAASAADPEYTGSERCGKCHATEYRSWKASYHSKMVRPKDEAILKDVVENWDKGGPTKVINTGAPAKLDDVELVLGSKWKQRFLVKNPATGGHLFLDKQWNTIRKQWENYGNKNDWETNCATCHSTGYRLTSYDEKNPGAVKWSMSERNVGCEACHGPGAAHAKAPGKAKVYSFKGKSVEEQTRVCGYCHIRGENEKFLTAQGKPSEHMPHPEVGKTWVPSEDWTRWYTDHAIIPGVHAEDKIDATYKGDLAGMMKVDDVAKAGGFYDAAKHHQQYQEFLQSAHYRKQVMSCSGCHQHASKAKPAPVAAKETCKSCHDASFTVEKYMPGTGSTAAGLFIRTHTFNKNQSRAPQTTADVEPVYYKQ